MEENIGIELVRIVAKRILKEYLYTNINELSTKYIEWLFSHYLSFNVLVTIDCKEENNWPLEIRFKCDGEECKFLMQLN